ncbi:helix-turn-helix transcriptional regulator [Methylobacterium sp. J-068]|uniref:helix-turn-helix transcriptional regulator n=1 Tax=Methylobacterium sp. J-068 TaxID=2836649 RepID=UPI001FB8A958|nr:autoinducer binding domain-containing protein [Methylobacterium sp. J-068]MCJ2034590.1 LuxR family transcriptional regulator [Methylobacterium sp. J-068]
MANGFCLDDALDLMAKAAGLDAMKSLLFELREAYGVANLVYHAAHVRGHAQAHPILALSYEEGWVKRYLDENYFSIDPVVQGGLRAFLPLDWATLDRRSCSTRRLFREADSYGVGRQGVTIPIHGPGGERALFTVTCNLSDYEWEKARVQLLREFHALAHFFHDRAVYLSGLRSDEPPRLSPRELQCIQLLAQGQKPKNIAYNLGISEAAVRLYTSSARTKMRCSTLIQTIAEAASTGLITC